MNANQSRRTADGWIPLLLPALVTVLGFQVMRVLFPMLLFVLRDRLGYGVIDLGIVGLGTFLLIFFAAPLHRALGGRAALWLTAGGLALVRLVIQLWRGDPLVWLVLAVIGTALFWMFWPVYLTHIRLPGHPIRGYRLALALFSGLILDLALHGLFLTYDPMWQGGLVALILTVLLVVGVVWVLWRIRLPEPAGARIPHALLWLAFGPFMLAQVLVFQNLARLNALTAWQFPASFTWAMLAQLTTLALIAWLARIQGQRLGIAAGLTLLLLVSWAMAWPSSTLAAALYLAGQLAAGASFALVLAGIGTGASKPSAGALSVANGVAGLLFMILTFLFYSGYDIALPVRNTALLPVAGLLISIPALVAGRLLDRAPAGARSDPLWLPLGASALLLIAPLIVWLMWDVPQPVAHTGGPIRVMTYNLHNGFATDGRLDLEALAQVIEAEQPDIIGLQEVSRGWAVNGSVDMLAWLSQRLEMPYVFGATSDPIWGIATLSRFPIVESDLQPLPPETLLLKRAFLRSRVDTGGGALLDFVNTHYHHPGGAAASAVRVEQSGALLDYLGARPLTVVVGDMNAVPEDPEIRLLSEAGLLEAATAAGLAPGFTYSALGPTHKIDYIWMTGDLASADASIRASRASDHLPIAATLWRLDE